MGDTVSGWGTAAKVAGCSPSKLRRLADRGELRAEKGGDGEWVFERGDLEALAARSRTEEDDEDALDDRDEGVMRTAEGERDADDAPVSATGTSRPVAASGFELLDGGAQVGQLVVQLGVEPSAAMGIYEAWRRAKMTEQPLVVLRDALHLARWLDGVGWSAEQVVEAYQQVHKYKTTVATGHYSGERALELLAVVAQRIGDFEEAVEVLERLPDVEAIEARVAAAREQLAAVRRGEAAARAGMERAHAELRALAQYAGWLKLAGALAEATSTKGQRMTHAHQRRRSPAGPLCG